VAPWPDCEVDSIKTSFPDRRREILPAEHWKMLGEEADWARVPLVQVVSSGSLFLSLLPTLHQWRGEKSQRLKKPASGRFKQSSQDDLHEGGKSFRKWDQPVGEVDKSQLDPAPYGRSLDCGMADPRAAEV